MKLPPPFFPYQLGDFAGSVIQVSKMSSRCGAGDHTHGGGLPVHTNHQSVVPSPVNTLRAEIALHYRSGLVLRVADLLQRGQRLPGKYLSSEA